jgi:hypothetical protein
MNLFFLMCALYQKPWDCINNAVSICSDPSASMGFEAQHHVPLKPPAQFAHDFPPVFTAAAPCRGHGRKFTPWTGKRNAPRVSVSLSLLSAKRFRFNLSGEAAVSRTVQRDVGSAFVFIVSRTRSARR